MSEPEKENLSLPAEAQSEGADAPQNEGPASQPESSQESPQPEPRSQERFSPLIPLRPLLFGEIFSGALAIIRRYFALILGISALVAVVAQGSSYFLDKLVTPVMVSADKVQTFSDLAKQLSDQISRWSGSDIGIMVAELVITVAADAFLAGFLIILIGKAIIGRPVVVAEVFAELGSRFVPLVALAIVYNVLKFIGLMFFILPGVWVSVLFMFATSVFILERARVGQALSRSASLIQGAWLRNFGVLLVCGLVYALLDLVLHAAFRLDSGALLSSFATPSAVGEDHSLLQFIVTLLTNAVTAPFIACVVTVAYLDQRMRKEDLAVQLNRAVDSEFSR